MSYNDNLRVGEYMLPIINDDTPGSDPWTRNYFAPPPHVGNLVARAYPLVDIRPQVEKADYSPTKQLQTHGFGIVKHHSATLEQSGLSDQESVDRYCVEIQELVQTVLGVKEVIVMVAGKRVGKDKPEEFRAPTGLKGVPLKQTDGERPPQVTAADAKSKAALLAAAPVRVPHIDFTPLGARQTIRHQTKQIKDAAADVIAHEDAIVRDECFTAAMPDANAIIHEKYNKDGMLGPRYAAYSIWRPLRKVGRDPITIYPRKEAEEAGGERVHWPYLNRIPGSTELGGKDWLKEFAMLGVKARVRPADDDLTKFYYISKQEPDEVMFIQLFDSASLGENATQAAAPYHASPEIGDIDGAQARVSCDVRVIAFW